jgi:hypothetical protein
MNDVRRIHDAVQDLSRQATPFAYHVTIMPPSGTDQPRFCTHKIGHIG